jgi:hypothetical protein
VALGKSYEGACMEEKTMKELSQSKKIINLENIVKSLKVANTEKDLVIQRMSEKHPMQETLEYDPTWNRITTHKNGELVQIAEIYGNDDTARKIGLEIVMAVNEKRGVL